LKGNILFKLCPGGVVAHPPQDQKTRVLIPQKECTYMFLGKHSNADLYDLINVHRLCVKHKNKGIGPEIF
jgi:hypothetical protein